MRFLHFGLEEHEIGLYSILYGLKNLGHIVKSVDIYSKFNFEEEAKMQIDEFNPDFIITIGGWHIHSDCRRLFLYIKALSIIHIYWAIEDPTHFEWVSLPYINLYDFVFTISEESLEKYKQIGVNAAFLPFSCNPDFHKRVSPNKKFACDILVLSNRYIEYRQKKCFFRDWCYMNIIKPVIDNGYDIKIFGLNWDDENLCIPKKNIMGYIDYSLVPVIYSSAKIVLMTQWDMTGHICFKTYEALGCACFQIAPYTILQEKYFKDKYHLVYTKSSNDTLRYVISG